jgi:hypothetical protein
MHALIPMNTRTQTLPLGAFSKTGLANPQDWQIRQRRLAVDRNLFFFELQNISEKRTYPYEYMYANPTTRSIFEDRTGKSSRLTNSPEVPRCRRERRLPLKAQTSLIARGASL